MKKTHRCSICNKVNDPRIATNLGDHEDQAYVEDPKDSMFSICLECREGIDEILFEWELDDMEAGEVEWELIEN